MQENNHPLYKAKELIGRVGSTSAKDWQWALSLALSTTTPGSENVDKIASKTLAQKKLEAETERQNFVRSSNYLEEHTGW